ncbi:S-layer homology domain-containing protein [Caldicellulosiruptoraceae bacterium PP1]
MGKKLYITIILLILLSLSSISAFSQYSDIPSNASYKSSVEKLTMLGIFQNQSKFMPNSLVTREDFARMIILISNLSEQAKLYEDSSVFPDVTANNKLIGYINLAIKKGYMTGLSDKKFHPKDSVTYAQVCTAVVRMLGYNDSDLSGTWPRNYIDKALDLGLTKGIIYKANEKVPKWAIAVILSRLLDTNVKSNNQNNVTFNNSVGLYKEVVILSTSDTNNKLAKNEVQTDVGILNNNVNFKFTVGQKYMVNIEDNDINKVYGSINKISQYTIQSYNLTTIFYEANKKINSFTLPINAAYYYNGNKITYDNLNTILKPYQQIILGYKTNNQGYDYVLIKDPLDESYGSYTECIILDDSKTSNKLEQNQVLTDKGIFYIGKQTKNIEVGYKYGLYIKDDTITAVFKKLNTVYRVDVDKVSDNTITYLDNGKEKSIILPQKAIYFYNGTKQSYDNLKNILKPSQRLYLAYNADKSSYEYISIKDLYDESYGTYTECIILDSSNNNNKLEKGQVLTDKGIYTLTDTKTKIDIGSKYALFIKDDKITLVYKKLNNSKSFNITDVDDYTVTISENNNEQTLLLPQKTTYFYNGTKQNYENLKNILKPSQLIYLATNSDNTGYEYAIIKDLYDEENYGTYTECVILDDSTTTDKLQKNQVLTDKGIFYKPNKINNLEIGYRYALFIKDNSITLVYKKLNTIFKGTITDFSDNMVTVEKGGANVKINLPQKATYYYNGAKQDYNSLQSILTPNQDIYFGYNKNEYDYILIKDKYSSTLGKYTECVILDNDKTTDKILENQVVTDKGIYNVAKNVGKLDIGIKYGVYIKDDTITSIYKPLNVINPVTISYIHGNTISIAVGNNESKEINLPKKTTYYYDGAKINYSDVIPKLQKNSTIIFGYNKTNSDYEYAVIYDPIYSKPQMADTASCITFKAGDIDFSDASTIIRNGNYIDKTAVAGNDVVYEVKDIFGNNRFILVVQNSIVAYIKDYKPNRIAPTSIVVQVYNSVTRKFEDTTYEISKDFDVSMLKSSEYNVGNYVYLYFGYDGKVVFIKY